MPSIPNMVLQPSSRKNVKKDETNMNFKDKLAMKQAANQHGFINHIGNCLPLFMLSVSEQLFHTFFFIFNPLIERFKLIKMAMVKYLGQDDYDVRNFYMQPQNFICMWLSGIINISQSKLPPTSKAQSLGCISSNEMLKKN